MLICIYDGAFVSLVVMVLGTQISIFFIDLQEFEPIIQKPYTIVYFHSAASLQL